MKTIRELIEKNPDVEFVVHIQNEQEFQDMLADLETLGFEYAIPLGTLREMAEDFVSTDGFDGCWRISPNKLVSYNASVEHWKLYCNDIVEFKNGEIRFHEEYTPEQREIELRKLRYDLFESEDKQYALQGFGLSDASPEEIEAKIRELIG